VLRRLLAPIGDDHPGLRDRALLLVKFVGALRRSKLVGIRIEDRVPCRGVATALLSSAGCPVRLPGVAS
jgi:site-specific recombinase XerC